jgi:hypothetical protein
MRVLTWWQKGALSQKIEVAKMTLCWNQDHKPQMFSDVREPAQRFSIKLYSQKVGKK